MDEKRFFKPIKIGSKVIDPPSTRYQGSKRRLLSWIYPVFKRLNFESALDGFGGTGSVSYLLKFMGKKVTFNDILTSNYNTGLAYIQNDSLTLSKEDIGFISTKNGFRYLDFISENYDGVYFTSEENHQLDIFVRNIEMMSELYEGETFRIKKAIAFHCLNQAALSKRPFNLFHRSNLSIRTREGIERTFGNKTTWERSFFELISRYASEHSKKLISNSKSNIATNKDIFQIHDVNFDLVYLDPPYRKREDENPMNYQFLYHFLEGLNNYNIWRDGIDNTRKTKPFRKEESRWSSNHKDFENIFHKFEDSVIVVSYWKPGYPTAKELADLLREFKRDVSVYTREHSYSLAKPMNETREVLIVGK